VQEMVWVKIGLGGPFIPSKVVHYRLTEMVPHRPSLMKKWSALSVKNSLHCR